MNKSIHIRLTDEEYKKLIDLAQMANLIIVNKNYTGSTALKNLTSYVLNPSRTLGFCGAQGVIIKNCINNMMTVNNYFRVHTGRQAQHFILSFSKNECVTKFDAMNLGYKICGILPNYQIVFGVHSNTDNLHLHFAMNPVSINDGHKFNFTYQNTYFLYDRVCEILSEYDIECKLLLK